MVPDPGALEEGGNVIRDVLCSRKEFVADSLRVFQYCEAQRITGYISALSIPNIVYIMRKELDAERSREILRTRTMVFSVVELRERDLLKAAELAFGDYEDAIQSVCAARVRASCIITRNGKNFVNSTVPAIGPADLVKQLQGVPPV